MPYNVLYLNKKADFGGSSRSLYYLLKFLNRKKFRPFVVYSEAGEMLGKIKGLSVPLSVLYFKPWRQLKYIFHQLYYILRLYSFIRKNKIELLHSNTYEYNPLGLCAARLARIPFLTHLRDDITKARAKKYLLHRSDLVISVSENIIRDKLTNYVVVRNGVDLDEIKKSVKKEKMDMIRDWLCPRQRGPVLGVIGIIGRNKNQLLLIDMAQALKRYFSRFRILIIGDVAEARYYDLLGQRIRDLHLEEHFVFTGPVENVYDYISVLDFVIVPSQKEAASRVILESMALKRVVLASDIPGNRELIEDNRNGFLFPLKRPGTAAERISGLYRNKSLQRRIAHRAFSSIRMNYSVRENTAEIERIYLKFLSGKTGEDVKKDGAARRKESWSGPE